MRLNIEITEQLQKNIKNYSLKNNLTIKELITSAIEEKIGNIKINNLRKDKIFTVGIICGGPSLERGISLNSARSVADHLECKNIIIKIFYIDQDRNPYEIDKKQLYSNTPSDFDFKIKTEYQS